MLKRILYIDNAAYVCVKNNQIIIKTNYNEQTISFSNNPNELGIIILDNPQITITHKAVNCILKNNGAIIWCDEKHLPISFLTSETSHYLRAKRIRQQISASQPKLKNLWKQIIKQKIINQAQVLKAIGKPHLQVLRFAEKVKSGDTTNEEAKAASLYWKIYSKDIFPDFSRNPESEVVPNPALNYGYSILRSAVARGLATAGLLLSYGIFHKNQYNPFALADDIMEPFRPWIDYQVFLWYKNYNGLFPNTLTKKLKQHLIQSLYYTAKWHKKHYSLFEAIEKTANSLAVCFEKKHKKLLLPEFPAKDKLYNIINILR